jgi:2-keto-4-pentenoate hydratase
VSCAVFLAGHLSQHGLCHGLAAGHLVITGTLHGKTTAEPGMVISTDFGEALGRIEMQFIE